VIWHTSHAPIPIRRHDDRTRRYPSHAPPVPTRNPGAAAFDNVIEPVFCPRLLMAFVGVICIMREKISRGAFAFL
jgi:hypothetical protein